MKFLQCYLASRLDFLWPAFHIHSRIQPARTRADADETALAMKQNPKIQIESDNAYRKPSHACRMSTRG